MTAFLPLLLAVIGPSAPEAHWPGAVQVFHCTFDPSWDPSYSGWPQGWTRRRGPGFPQYVRVRIAGDAPPVGGRSLRMELDGGAVTVFSPPVPVSPRQTYVLDAYVKTGNLEHDRACLSLGFFDENRRMLAGHESLPVQAADGWQRIRVGPVAPAEGARTAVIGLCLGPQSRDEDLSGTASFGDVWLGCLPRVSLAVSPGLGHINFFTDPNQVEVACTASGFAGEAAEIVCVLEDVAGRQMARSVERLAANATAGRPTAADGTRSVPATAAATADSRWKPPIPGPGFFRIRASLRQQDVIASQAEATVVVLADGTRSMPAASDPALAPAGSEFGWSLPQGDRPLPLDQLASLVVQAGIGWVKYPVWLPPGSDAALSKLVAFNDRLNEAGIELVALLQSPVDEAGAGNARGGVVVPAAEVFAGDPKTWYPGIEPLLARLATQIRWWQIGSDRDTSLAAQPDLSAKMLVIQGVLDKIGQGVHLGVPRRWETALPAAAAPKRPCDFLTFMIGDSLSGQEVSERLRAAAGAGAQRWVVIEPLPRSAGKPDARAAHLVGRMIAAKIAGAERISLADPFDRERGLIGPSGQPSELFLPWRTTALALGGSQYLGTMDLPGGSTAHVFARRDEIVMAVWNDRAIEETACLGNQARQVDVWGRSSALRPQETGTGSEQDVRNVANSNSGDREVPVPLGKEATGSEQDVRIPVDRLPTILVGLDPCVVRWQLGLALAQDCIPSIPRQPQANSLRLKNVFPRAVSGTATFTAPEGWQVEPSQISFRLSPAEERTEPVTIILPSDVLSGRQQIRMDFEIKADRTYRFSACRSIYVGLDDLVFEVESRLNQQGELEVEQTFVNRGNRPVSFHCQLFAPDRRRLATQVIGLEPGRDVQVYRLPEGTELLGKTLWLRADEIDGPRTLNHRFTDVDRVAAPGP